MTKDRRLPTFADALLEYTNGGPHRLRVNMTHEELAQHINDEHLVVYTTDDIDIPLDAFHEGTHLFERMFGGSAHEHNLHSNDESDDK